MTRATTRLGLEGENLDASLAVIGFTADEESLPARRRKGLDVEADGRDSHGRLIASLPPTPVRKAVIR